MKTFFLDIEIQGTFYFYQLEAPDLLTATRYLNFYLLGIQFLGAATEVLSISTRKTKGREYRRLA